MHNHERSAAGGQGNTIRKTYESDESGMIRVSVPVGAPHRRVEVVVTWDEPNDAVGARARKRAELERLAGVLADDPLQRGEQPAAEHRLPVG